MTRPGIDWMRFGMRRAVRALLMVAIGVAFAGRAQARPEYAQREMKACQYCHMSATPGGLDAGGTPAPTTRNNRGLYYQSHNHTFAGYIEREVMGSKSPPIFHFVWKEDLTDNPRRVAVADVTDDGKPRLVTLNEKPGQPNAAILMVKKWDGKAFTTEFTTDVQGPADKLAVGHFDGPEHAAEIITSDGLWYWNGTTFTHKAASHSLSLFGTTRMKGGQERVLIANTADNIQAYRVQTDTAADWLVDPIKAPQSSAITFGDMHAAPAFLQQIFPPSLISLTRGGLLGLWDARNFGTLFLYIVKVDPDPDVKPNPSGPTGAATPPPAKSTGSYVVFRNPNDAMNLRPYDVWSTPRFQGMVYDVGFADPEKSGQTGLLVLTSESASGNGRSLYFFALD